MFEHVPQPYLTVETGEAYQPVRLVYEINNLPALIKCLNQLRCIQKSSIPYSWSWHWEAECDDVHFESVDTFKKDPERPVRLGLLNIQGDRFYIYLPSFKRACLAVTFFYRAITQAMAVIHYADFVNILFALDEPLPRGFTELFKEEDLNHTAHDRTAEYAKVKASCEDTQTTKSAAQILLEYKQSNADKLVSIVDRYVFELSKEQLEETDISFIAFYIFLRSRELVAIKRWYGQMDYSLADVTGHTIKKVFGYDLVSSDSSDLAHKMQGLLHGRFNK